MEKENDIYMRCFLCGGPLCWNSDFDAYDVSDMYEEDDYAVCGFYTCTCCGRYYEVLDPPREERDTTYRKYWHDGEQQE